MVGKLFKLSLLGGVLSGLVACGGGASNSANSISNSNLPINPNWGGGNSPIMALVAGSSSGLNALSNGTVWQANLVFTDTAAWQWVNLGAAESTAATTALSLNSNGILFAANALGNVYLYANGAYSQLGRTTQNSAPNSMAVTNGNQIYLGNQAGNLWFYSGGDSGNWSANLAAGGFVPAGGGVIQVAVDNPSAPQYLGVASGAYVWACQLSSSLNSCNLWKNIVQVAEERGLYTDSGSLVNALGIYQTGTLNYGYFGNAAGHVWRAIYNTASATLLTFDNMNIQFSGFPGASGAITSLISDKNNNLYVGTANGTVLIWTQASGVWSNITPTGAGGAAITALEVISSTSSNGELVVGNNVGKMWAIFWQ